MAARRYDEAIAQLRNTFADGAGFLLGASAARIGAGIKGHRQTRPSCEYQRAAELNDDPRVLAFVGHAMASTGKQDGSARDAGQTCD